MSKDVRDLLRATRGSGAKSSAKEVARLLMAPGSDPGRRVMLGTRKGSNTRPKATKKRTPFLLALRTRPVANRNQKAKSTGTAHKSTETAHKSTGTAHKSTGNSGGGGDGPQDVTPDLDGVSIHPVHILKSIYALGRASAAFDSAEESPSDAEEEEGKEEDVSMDFLQSVCSWARASADASRTTFTQTDPEKRTASTQTLKKKPPKNMDEDKDKDKVEEIPEEIRLAMYV